MNVKLKDQIILHIIVLIWGYTGIIGKWSTLDSDQLVLIRMGSAFLALSFFLRRALFRVPLKAVLQFMVVGVIIALHWITFFAAIEASNVSVALACLPSTSVFVAFIEPLLFRRPIALDEVATSVLALIGVVFIFGTSEGYELGVCLALVSSLLAAIFTTINGVLYQNNVKTWAPRGGSAVMTSYEMLGGFSAIALYQFFFGTDLNTWALSMSSISLGVILGIFCTAIPFVGSIYVMRSLSPFTACLTVNLEPVYAILLALIHFGDSEKMSPSFYLATLLILASVTLNGFLKSKSSKERTTEGSRELQVEGA